MDIWAYDSHIKAVYLSKLGEEEISGFAEEDGRRQFDNLIYFFGELNTDIDENPVITNYCTHGQVVGLCENCWYAANPQFH